MRFALGNGGVSGLRIPGSAILYGSNGPSVAVVGANGVVKMTPVTIARDEGKTVLVSTGVKPADKIIDSPPDSIATGDKVDVVTPAKTGAGDKPHG